MKISNVYIGGWFQRTMLQLTEIYDFLRDCKSQLNLDPEKLQEFRKSLEIGKIDYGVAGEEYIEFTTALNMKVKVFEDGLITVNNTNVSDDTLFADLDKITDYYENKLSPAFNYLFSLGAPVPKELAHIEYILILLFAIMLPKKIFQICYLELKNKNILNFLVKNMMLLEEINIILLIIKNNLLKILNVILNHKFLFVNLKDNYIVI